MFLSAFVFIATISTQTTVKALHNKYCNLSCDFGYKIFTNTVCQRENEKCGPHERCGADFRVVEFDDDFRQFVLDLHNEMRNTVALGDETRGNQPPGADLMVLKYNRELEFIAQCWANTCNGNPLIHDNCRSTSDIGYVGQNLGFYNRSDANINVTKTVKDLITYWYDEVADFKREWVNYTDDRGPDVKVGHYTQMLWSSTTDLGCAATYYTTNDTCTERTWHHLLLVCNYGPGGNYITLPVYEVGKPCSKCPGNLKPNEDFPGLCGEGMAVNETGVDFEPIFTV